MKKIKVLLDTTPLSNANAVRGVGVYTKVLAEYLQKNNHVEIETSGPGKKSAQFNPDVIHYPFFDLFFLTLPMVRFKPTVVTVHDAIPLRYPKYYPPGVKGRIKLQKQKLALKTCDAIITDSQASKLDVETLLGIEADKVHVVYLAANPKLSAQKQEQIEQTKEKHDLPDQYLLYVGDINYNKNIPQLIKALKFLPKQINLVLVGKNFKQQEIPEWKAIQTQMALSDVADRVYLLNQITGDADQELSALYSGAAAYVQPSLFEGFGLPILEAMQCRTPVISAENSSLTEVGGKHVIYTQTRAEKIAEKVEQVLSWTKTKRQQHVKKAYEWSQTFSWKKTAQETVAVYQSLFKK